MRKIKVVLFMGGDSGEYEVSIASASQVENNLDTEKFEVYPVLIRNGNWTYTKANGDLIPFDRNNHCLEIENKTVKFDCAFIAIHGTPGEDGKLQGYLDIAGIPYTTCDVTTSALTFNKYFSNDLAIQYGVKVARTILLRKGDTWNAETLAKEVGLPCFVKPNKSGSSFGISKVISKEELIPAIENAYKEDNEIIIESFLNGIEVSVGVINYKGKITVLPITEIVSENDFFDYEAKYLGKSQEITPARISDELKEKIETVAKRAYEVLKMKGFSRSEFIIVNNEPYMLEMNTIPGMTTESILPQQAKVAGISLSDLFDNAIELALTK
jgi:D-alanine-D-alanine ligase